MSTPTTKPPAQPSLSPNHVALNLRTMKDTIVTIRNAARCSKIDASRTEQLRLADDADEAGRMMLQLGSELRRCAR